MQRVHIDQAVTLTLDGVDGTIECHVVDVQCSVTRLAYHDELPPQAVGRLVHGVAGYILFDESSRSVALRVAVRATPPHLAVALMDGVPVIERRASQRVKLVTRARIISPHQHDHRQSLDWTHTLDISERGALLRDHPALDGHCRFELELMLGEDPITVRAEVARRADDTVGVAFESKSDDDATRLSQYLTGIRRQRALV